MLLLETVLSVELNFPKKQFRPSARMLWITFFLLALNASDAVHKDEGGLMCECTTTACLGRGERRCRTGTGLCFAQRLGQRVVRGCTAGRTPLLCENRPPLHAAAAGWPLLLCCARPLCNRRAVPSPPPWYNDTRPSDGAADDGVNTTTIELPSEINSTLGLLRLSPTTLYSRVDGQSSSYLPQLVSPVTLSVVGVGAIGLVAVGVVATMLLRKKDGRYYGSLEHDPRQCDCVMAS